jgi:hypothetical protein
VSPEERVKQMSAEGHADHATGPRAGDRTPVTDPPPSPIGVGRDRGSAPTTPGWITVLAVVVVVLVVLMFVVLHLTGAVGPGVH